FVIFARFEYVLKRSKYLQSERAAADWEALARDLDDYFLAEVVHKGIAQTLTRAPPHKQIVEGGQLAWRDTGPINDTRDLFLAIRRVRNNLFFTVRNSGPSRLMIVAAM